MVYNTIEDMGKLTCLSRLPLSTWLLPRMPAWAGDGFGDGFRVFGDGFRGDGFFFASVLLGETVRLLPGGDDGFEIPAESLALGVALPLPSFLFFSLVDSEGWPLGGIPLSVIS